MAIQRFTGTWKTRDDVMDIITPNNVVQPNVSVPAGEWKPAAWLPIVWSGEASKDSFVISSGKVVSFDREGRIVPSGYKKVFQTAGAADVVLTYTSADVSAGVLSLATGQTAAAGSLTLADVADGLLARGLVEHEEVSAGFTVAGTFNPALDLDCQVVCAAFVSEPVGVCSYDVYVWAGESYDSFNYLNYQKQHLIQFFTDIQMQVPHAALAAVTTGDLSAVGAWSETAGADGAEFPSAELAGAELLVTAAQLAALARYDGVIDGTEPVVAFALQEPPAKNTDRTPVSSTASLLTRERSGPTKIKQAGDWVLDADARLLWVYSADGATNPAGAGETATFFHYDNAASSQWRQVCAVGDLKPGDFLTYDAYSNFVKLDVDASTLPSEMLGRVLGIVSQPKGLLERVRTAWDGSSFSAEEQMPGTATAGFTDLITLSPENVAGTSGVADQVVLLNLKMS